MRRSYKFRIYPTAERREAWRMGKAGIRYGQQSAQLKDIRALDQDQGRWSFSSQQATLRRLDKAMAAFYRRCRAGEKRAGYPRFKALDRWDCVEWPSDGDGCRSDRSPRPAARSALMSAWHGSRPPATARSSPIRALPASRRMNWR